MSDSLKSSPLEAAHLELGARMVPFAFKLQESAFALRWRVEAAIAFKRNVFHKALPNLQTGVAQPNSLAAGHLMEYAAEKQHQKNANMQQQLRQVGGLHRAATDV